ncbi:hypothetical protein HPP92_004983 [Vanilla planifolia]|uniref:Protein kinase domain-containing protein n=1 Tax=Vanilla planifolia TaxID=51239 RepID=A0A835VAX1_VANPL|nr:hypothetical protein HPP92_004983 [Vanilla planifolia]
MAPARWIRGPTIGHGSTATVFLATSYPLLEMSSPSNRPSSAAPTFSGANRASCRRSAAHPSLPAAGWKSRRGTATPPAFYNLFLDLGIVHCDVKPANVLIDSEGRAKIGDLGCARWLAASEGVIRGSPMYMSPEAVRGEEQGTPADVWALGCTMIEMVTGRPPWTEISDAVAAINALDCPAMCRDSSLALRGGEKLPGKCLRLEPEERWTTRTSSDTPLSPPPTVLKRAGCLPRALWI